MTLTNNGTTLIELMTTISIITLTIFLTVPSIQFFMVNRFTDRLTLELEQDLHYARSQASMLNRIIEFKPLNNWRDGWKISSIDPINNRKITLRERSHSLEAHDISSPTIKSSNPLVFSSNGITLNDALFTINVKRCSGNRVRTFLVNRVGQVQLMEAKQCI